MNSLATNPGPRPRRGNTIVLVVGILVLLVIIATSYVTRTHAGRVTAVSQQRASLRDDNARVIGESIADEIGGALFVRPLVPGFFPPIALSNDARWTPPNYLPVRYGVDPQDYDGDGLPDFPYNFAPYQVTPFTNWPDNRPPPNAQIWPVDPGTSDPFEGNPIGPPGFGDTRWLADTEPMRMLDGSGDSIFSHWRHMTNLSRPGNGWRICKDISDVGNQTGIGLAVGIGGVLVNLGIPVEQFIYRPGDLLSTGTGLPNVIGLSPPHIFEDRWHNWFHEGPFDAIRPGYKGAYRDATWIPSNFLNLRDLDGNGVAHDFFNIVPQDRPESEFVPFTARHTVGRFLADADGDGFTDAFWFLAPTMTERGIRQVVAVRIVDNGAMLNANVATRFAPFDIASDPLPYRTRGTTPSDLALVGGLVGAGGTAADWNVGFYDNHDHDFGFNAPNYYSEGLWNRHLVAIGLWDYIVSPSMPDQFLREDYWRRQGSFPLGADPQSPYTPFGIPDEIELRMFHGNNYPWIFSRLEGTTEISANVSGALRGNLGERGSNEILEQLRNPDLVDDSRRKLTLYNGARNDLMPPWLWPTLLLTDRNLVPGIDDGDVRQYLADMRKLDLRQPRLDFDGFVLGDVDQDGVVEPVQGVGGTGDDPTDDDFDFDFTPGILSITEMDHICRVREYLDRALLIRDPGLPPLRKFGKPLDSYFGDGIVDMARAEQMAAAMAANIAAYQDIVEPDPALEGLRVSEAVPVRSFDRSVVPPQMQSDRTLRYLGLEMQPFLVEAVIAHVHEAILADNNHQNVLEGHYVVCYTGLGDDNQDSIVVVQIANPFDRAIDLSRFRISVFGQELDLSLVPQNMFLAPNRARTYVSMPPDGPVVDVAAWRDVLNIAPIGIVGGLPGFDDPDDLVDVSTMGVWSKERNTYDIASANHAIELSEVDRDTLTPVLIDRIDIKPGLPGQPDDNINIADAFDCEYRKVGRVVQTFRVRAGLEIISDCDEPPGLPNVDWPDVIPIGPDFNHWVQWVRASRPWVQDLDTGIPPTGDEMRDDRKNPRYVFSRAFVDARSSTGAGYFNSPTSLYNSFGGNDSSTKIAHFANRDKHLCDGDFDPDIINTELQFAMQMLQKDGDFDQVGELLNVWLFGHEIETTPIGAYIRTTSTFSEWMWDDLSRYLDAPPTEYEKRRSVNRLQPVPVQLGSLKTGAIMGAVDPALPLDPLHPFHAIPALPATARVLEAFVIDGHGANLQPDNYEDAQLLRLNNANGFTGRMTPGLININTATPEVIRSAPHMARIVGLDQSGDMLRNPRVHVPEAIVAYRDRVGQQYLPDYKERDSIATGLRSERGFASIGELLLMRGVEAEATDAPPGDPDPLAVYQKSFRIDFAAGDPIEGDPFRRTPPESSWISTDVIDDGEPGFQMPDVVAGDAEEANLLFAGMSNMITTRSDVFTVYFKVRSFTQNPTTGRWDATDPEYIVDDSRYVMLVDRSEVNRPSDKPKIVYLEKLPK